MAEELRINGKPFGTVHSEAEFWAEAAKDKPGEKRQYVLMRVADADTSQYPPELRERNRRVPCEVCGEICWYDPKTLHAYRMFTLEWICVQCSLARMRLRKALGGQSAPPQ